MRQAGILHVGGFHPELEAALAAHLTDVQRERPLRPVRIIVANNLLGRQLSRLLAERSGGCLNVRFGTFLDLMRELAAPLVESQRLKALPPQGGRVLLKRLLREKRARLDYFAEAAELEGFVEALLAAFADLVEAGLDAEQLRRAAKQARDIDRRKLREVADLFEFYQRALAERSLFDPPQLGPLALQALDDDPQPFAGSELAFYGFYDFNAQQRAIVERVLNGRAQAGAPAAVFFPCRPLSAYAATLPTLEWLRGLGLEEQPARHPLAALPRGLQRLREEDIFAELSPRNSSDSSKKSASRTADESAGIALISAPHETAEAAEIARVIAAEPAGGIASWENGILQRTPHSYGQIWRNLFIRLGRPAWRQGGRPLSETAAARSFLLLGRLLESDFARGPVMEFFGYARVDYARLLGVPALTEANQAAWETLSIELGVTQGRQQWRERLEHRCLAEAENGGTTGDQESAAQTLRRAIASLSEATAAIAAGGSWSVYAAQFRAALDSLLEQDIEGRTETLAVLDRLGGLEVVAESTTLAEFLREARRTLEAEGLSEGAYERSGPALCELIKARGVSWRRVFLPGVCDKSFPRPVRQNPVLLDTERRALNKALAQTAAADRPPPVLNLLSSSRDEERLLFQLGLEAAREQLTLTAPRASAGGGMRSTSSFLQALVDHFALDQSGPAPLSALPNFTRIGMAHFFPATPTRSLGPEEFDLAQTARLKIARPPSSKQSAKAARSTLAAGYLRLADGRIVAAARLEEARFAKRLTEFDGLLAAPDLVELLRRRHSPFARELSATRLERYAVCPLAYFFGDVLGLATVEAPEEIELLSPLDRGRLLHYVYQDFYETLRAEDRLPLRAEEAPELRALILKLAKRRFAYLERRALCGFPATWRAERERLEQDLEEFVNQELAQEPPSSPVRLEARFGRLERLAEQTEEGARPALALVLDDEGRTVHFHGVIDRVDHQVEVDDQTDNEIFRVIDYKTGRGPGGKARVVEMRSFEQGRQLQLPIYLLAGRQMAAGEVLGAEYYYSTRRGGFQRCILRAEDFAQREERLKRVVALLCDSLENGRFFHLPRKEYCGFCEFKGACGPAREERAKQKETDPVRLNFDRLLDLDPPPRPSRQR